MKVENLEMKKDFFESLNERQRRHFAAIEAKQLGHGGIAKVSESLGIHRETIRIGIQELSSKEKLEAGRIRKAGGGRKKKF